jgi:hypothetical protein
MVRNDCSPVLVVDEITKAGSVHDSEAQTNTVFFDICIDKNPVSDNRIPVIRITRHRPALILSIATVFGRSALGGKTSLGGYRVVLNSVLTKVDFPKPDSPCIKVSR